ncbi:glycosyltransferase [Streptomyces sp. CBMA152]|uniref:glycosyltransferase n=1 Tax=Streptomyces sp. CBMA152 TaxID=1896312 RepID=UPI00166106E1|nr:glycosyltransferase [Streptomyces sp. CBMA152]MBD0746865.1 UDP-glucose--sterol glucosyltransferase [Streptomyces sp. CBMA152]
MKILITAAGSYGDVAPYTGLGAHLRREGHEVALAAPESFAALVKSAGLEFRPLPGDPRAKAASGNGSGTTSGAGSAPEKRALMRAAGAYVKELAGGLADTVEQGTELMLLSTTTAPLGWHITEATGTPGLGVYLQPTHPTREFAPVVAGAKSLGAWGNRAMGRFSLKMVDRVFTEAVRDLRARLDLPAATPGEVRSRTEPGWTVLHGYSPAVVPQPRDWRDGLEAVGNWWPYHAPDAELPTAVEDFLRSGPPPVFIGFGSMAAGEGERLGELAVRALRSAGLRGILQTGQAGLHASGDDVLTVGELPHALLFPRVAAVVHHGGAGTTAAALRAGVPAVPVPVTADQPFWAARLVALGAAPCAIPFKRLTAERLADALGRAVRDSAPSRAAADLSRRMAGEDGAGRVASAVARLAG